MCLLGVCLEINHLEAAVPARSKGKAPVGGREQLANSKWKAKSKKKNSSAQLSDKLLQNRISVQLRAGEERWQAVANLGGRFKDVMQAKRVPMKIAMRFPHAQAGEQAIATLLTGGELRSLSGTSNPRVKGKEKERLKSATNPVVTRTGRNGVVQLEYRFGEQLYTQRIEVRVGLAKGTLTLHLVEGDE